MRRDAQNGVVLINVLVLLALATAVVYAMLSLADISIARSQRFSEAGQALALLRAGEQSAIVALRRDMLEAPDNDHRAEPWGLTAQSGIEIAGGAFELAIADAQGLFNLNLLARPDQLSLQTLRAIVDALELSSGTTERIAASIALDGPLRQLDDLTWRAGIPAEDIALLASLVTALPGRGRVNMNTAPPALLAILLSNPAQARALVAIRERAGFITPEDLAAANIIPPPGSGLRSELYRVRVTARIGNTAQATESLLQRRAGPGGRSEVAVIERKNATAAVSPPPPSS